MKSCRSIFLCISIVLVLPSRIAFADEDPIGSRMRKVEIELEMLKKDIESLNDIQERNTHRNSLMELCSAFFPFSFLNSVNGSDELQEEESRRLFVEAVYLAFLAEQTHCERTILHVPADAPRAIALMMERVRALCRLFPLGVIGDRVENVYFMQYMFNAAKCDSDTVINAIRSEVPRWGEEISIAPLVFLAWAGDLEAKVRLESTKSKDDPKLRQFGEHITKRLTALRDGKQ